MLNFIVIGDIHIGKKDARILKKELDEKFIGYINDRLKKSEGQDIDMIFIAGDYFDRIIRMNETAGVLAIELMMELIELCKNNDIKLRIIKGTKTHDYNQLNMFSQMEMDNPNTLSIFDTVGSEEIKVLDKKYNILYLPEEYPTDFDHFYDQYLNVEDGKYDIIIGHGMIDFVSFVDKEEESSESPVKSAPVFKSSELMRICKGPIVFGHIHDAKEYKDKIYYTGSFSRYSFADTEDKGFYKFSYDKDKKKFNSKFIENTMAPTYVTIDIDEFQDISEDKKIDIIEEMKSKYDYIRFTSSDSASIDIVRKLSENDSNIKIKVKNNDIKEIKVDEKYRFILEKKYDVPETIQKFIKIKNDIDIDLDVVRDIIKPLE